MVRAGFVEETGLGLRPEQWVGCRSWDLGEQRYGGESKQGSVSEPVSMPGPEGWWREWRQVRLELDVRGP